MESIAWTVNCPTKVPNYIAYSCELVLTFILVNLFKSEDLKFIDRKDKKLNFHQPILLQIFEGLELDSFICKLVGSSGWHGWLGFLFTVLCAISYQIISFKSTIGPPSRLVRSIIQLFIALAPLILSNVLSFLQCKQTKIQVAVREVFEELPILQTNSITMNKETYSAYSNVWSVDESQACFGSTYVFASILVLAILVVCCFLLKVNCQFAQYSRASATYSIKSYTAYSSIALVFILTISKSLSQIEVGISITSHLWLTAILFSLQIVLNFILQPTYSTPLNAIIQIRNIFVWIIICLHILNRRSLIMSSSLIQQIITLALLLPVALLIYVRLNSQEDQVEYLIEKAKTGNCKDLFEIEIRIAKHYNSCTDSSCPCS